MKTLNWLLYVAFSLFTDLVGLLYVAFSLFTALVGKQIHGSVFWAIVDFFLPVLVWLKWVVCGQVNLTVIKQALAVFAP